MRPRVRTNCCPSPSCPRIECSHRLPAEFAVDGTKIPDVDFDIGESYAGLLPISDNANETRKLYFWYAAGCLSFMRQFRPISLLTRTRFFPSTNPNATDEITIW